MLLVVVLIAGCARFTTTQKDIRYDDAGEVAGMIVTRATCTTFMNSRSALANFKATQTEKTQSASVGSLAQESTATNVVSALNALARIAEAVRPAP